MTWSCSHWLESLACSSPHRMRNHSGHDAKPATHAIAIYAIAIYAIVSYAIDTHAIAVYAIAATLKLALPTFLLPDLHSYFPTYIPTARLEAAALTCPTSSNSLHGKDGAFASLGVAQLEASASLDAHVARILYECSSRDEEMREVQQGMQDALTRLRAKQRQTTFSEPQPSGGACASSFRSTMTAVRNAYIIIFHYIASLPHHLSQPHHPRLPSHPPLHRHLPLPYHLPLTHHLSPPHHTTHQHTSISAVREPCSQVYTNHTTQHAPTHQPTSICSPPCLSSLGPKPA